MTSSEVIKLEALLKQGGDSFVVYDELLSRQQVQTLIDLWRYEQPPSPYTVSQYGNGCGFLVTRSQS